MSVIVISVDGIPITDDVLLAGASFTSLVNGRPGQCSFRVLDQGHTRAFATGASIELSVDGTLIWGGYVRRVRSVYPISVMDTTKSPAIVPRIWAIEGVDYNILFQERVVFKPSDPIGKTSFNYSVDTYDDTIINDIFDNYLDISGDGLTRTGVQRIAKAILDIPNVTHKKGASIVSAGSPWDVAMREVATATGGVYYITPDKNLHYVDAGTVTSVYTLTDQPYANPGAAPVVYQDSFSRVVAGSWGGDWTDIGSSTYSTMSVDGSAGLVTSSNAFGDNTYNQTGQTTPISQAIRDGSDWVYRVKAKRQVPTCSTGRRESMTIELFTDPDWSSDIAVWLSEANVGWAGPVIELSVGWWSATGSNVVASSVASWPFGVWYNIALGYDPTTQSVRGKWWLDSDAEPGWQITLTGDASLNFIDPVGEVPVIHVQPTAYGGNAVIAVDDVSISSTGGGGGGGNVIGYQAFSILEDGSNLVNDMLAWGSGMGSANYVFSRTQDATSITNHNRWQNSINTSGVYRQTTADIVADSYVYGTPQSLRGGKDDATSFICRVFEPVFQVAEVVPIVCGIFGFTRSLPIRRMRTTFASPTSPIFDLLLSNAIDLPISIFEQTPFITPRPPPRPPPLPPPPPEDCDITDMFNGSVLSPAWYVEFLHGVPGYAVSNHYLRTTVLAGDDGDIRFTRSFPGPAYMAGTTVQNAQFRFRFASADPVNVGRIIVFFAGMDARLLPSTVTLSFGLATTSATYSFIEGEWYTMWMRVNSALTSVGVSGWREADPNDSFDLDLTGVAGVIGTSFSWRVNNYLAPSDRDFVVDLAELDISSVPKCQMIASSGFICQTVEHVGGSSFTTLYNFTQLSLEVYINGIREFDFTSSGTAKTFTLSTAIVADDFLRVCYTALSNLYGASN